MNEAKHNYLFQELTEWENALLAYVFLNPRLGLIEESADSLKERLPVYLIQLNSLPRSWGIELCRAALVE